MVAHARRPIYYIHANVHMNMYHVHVCGVCRYVCIYVCMFVCLFVLKLLSFQSDGQADETARQADKQHRNPDNASNADRFSDGAKDVALEIRHGYDILQDIPDGCTDGRPGRQKGRTDGPTNQRTTARRRAIDLQSLFLQYTVSAGTCAAP